LHMLANVQQTTIQPIIEATIARGALVHTDEYDIYARLPSWGYGHKTVCHSRGEYARDEDGDGFCEVHVNTIEGVWSLLRSWLRPHRGISQEKLPYYLDPSLDFSRRVTALQADTDPVPEMRMGMARDGR
jgi:transposase